MEACEYGLTRGTRCVARRLEVAAVAGLLWISCCVLGAAGFFSCFFFSSDALGLLTTPCLIYLSTSTGLRTGWLFSSHTTAVRNLIHHHQKT